jgi:uncharacterized protein YecE (DUF72 family)
MAVDREDLFGDQLERGVPPIGNIRIGTSGYSFDDWRGPFYPLQLDKRKMLDYYVGHFPTVEVNSTYYRIPPPRVFESMVKRAPDQFDFMVKAPQSFTHRRADVASEVDAFRNSIAPLVESGKLSGVLAQFPYSFKFTPKNLDHVALCRDACGGIPLFAECRHDGWVSRSMCDRLKAEGIGYVSVDEPQLPGLLKPDCFATTDTAYIRLHGRNGEKWWDGGPLRYDYKYSDAELEYWREKVRKIMEKVRTVYIFFNNCHEGQAVDNARAFQSMLAGQSS